MTIECNLWYWAQQTNYKRMLLGQLGNLNVDWILDIIVVAMLNFMSEIMAFGCVGECPFILRRYMLLYLEVKCHHVFNLISSDSAKYSCFIYIHMEWERGREKMRSKMLKTDEMSFINEICSIYLTGLF